MKRLLHIMLCLVIAVLAATAAYAGDENGFQLEDHLEWNGYAWSEINGNIPYFTDADMTIQSYENYSDLDSLGRCGAATACLGPETLPTEPRGEIGSVKPTGWHTVKYPDQIKDKYLFNRCHLIAYELSAENANEKNLVTGTRYMNVEGMLDFEDEATGYIKSTKNHVMYRSTPIFYNDELVCRGVLLEAKSVEDNGTGICFCIWCPNVQPGIGIDYATGESWIDNTVTENSTALVPVTNALSEAETAKNEISSQYKYVINTRSNKFHKLDCSSVESMSPSNKQYTDMDKDSLIASGFTPCGSCNP